MNTYIDKLEDYKKSNGQPLSEKSKDLYIRTIDILIKKNGLDWRLSKLQDFIKDFSTSTKLVYINSVINYLTVMGYTDKQMLKYKQYKKSLEDTKSEQPQMSEKKSDNLVSWEDILKWRDILCAENNNKDTYTTAMLETLLRLYTTYPRRNELGSLKYKELEGENTELDKNTNYLLNKEGDLYLRLVDYKTAGKYGEKIFQITDPDLIHCLNNYLEKNEWREHLFNSPKFPDKPLTNVNLTKTLQRSSKKHLGKMVSTDRIRKAYASQNKEVIEKLESDADLLGHSVATNLKYYNVVK